MKKLLILLAALAALPACAQVAKVIVTYPDPTQVRVTQQGVGAATIKLSPDFLSPVVDSFSVTAPLVETGSVISITQAATGANGYLSSTDWNTFNGKFPTSGGTLTGKLSVSPYEYSAWGNTVKIMPTFVGAAGWSPDPVLTIAPSYLSGLPNAFYLIRAKDLAGADKFTVYSDGTVTAASLSCSPTISSGSGAPSSTPSKIGNIYVDTTNHKLYFADCTTNSGCWVIAN